MELWELLILARWPNLISFREFESWWNSNRRCLRTSSWISWCQLRHISRSNRPWCIDYLPDRPYSNNWLYRVSATRRDHCREPWRKFRRKSSRLNSRPRNYINIKCAAISRVIDTRSPNCTTTFLGSLQDLLWWSSLLSIQVCRSSKSGWKPH